MKKAISVIEIKAFLIIGIVALFGFSFLINFIKENSWIIYFGILILVIFIIVLFFQNQEEKKCKKCSSQNTILINLEEDIIGWKYMTKKGLPDRRRKNNKTKYLKTKKFKCNDCEHIFEVKSTYER